MLTSLLRSLVRLCPPLAVITVVGTSLLATLAAPVEAAAQGPAPKIVITPGNKTIYSSDQTYYLTVTIEYCSYYAHDVDLDSRVIELRTNGVWNDVRTDFGDGEPSYPPQEWGCEWARKYTGTVALPRGSTSSIWTEVDAYGVTTANFAWADYDRPRLPRAVAASVDAAYEKAQIGTTQDRKFRIVNTSSDVDSVSYAYSCTGAASCTAGSGKVILNGGAESIVTVSHTISTTVGDTGLVQLTAWATGASSIASVATTDVVAGPPPSLGVVKASGVPVVVRGACLTIAAGDGAAYECGDLRLAHALPAVRTFGKVRAPTLIYNSQHAHPQVLLPADVTIPASSTPPATVQATLYMNGGSVTQSWSGADWGTAGVPRRIAIRWDASALYTYIYDYTLEVRTIDNGVSTLIGTVSGQLPVVNRAGAHFGAGWWVAGFEQVIHRGAGDHTVAWIGGDGSTRLYRPTPTPNVWLADNADRPDTLTWDGVYYRRRLPDGSQTRFDATSGLHLQTVDRLGRVTSFGYDGQNRLSTITVPTPAGAPAITYTFNYSAYGYLSSVTVPGAGGATRTVGIGFTEAANKISSITDPDGWSVSFTYDPTVTKRIVSRTDRRGYYTGFTYDPIGRLTATALNIPGQTIGNAFRPAEVMGAYGGSHANAQPLDSVYTRVDGPRYDSTDVTKFWLNRFGTPERIRDAHGRETHITYDAVWPALAASVRDPSRATTRAFYNARGLLDSTTVGDPLGVAGTPAPTITGAMLSQSGLSVYSLANAVDGSAATHAWHTDGSGPGAYLQVDFGAWNAKSLTSIGVYALTSYAGVYDVRYSADGTTWSTAATGFRPDAGWRSIAWASVGAHRYWRLVLMNTPGPGAWLMELAVNQPGYAGATTRYAWDAKWRSATSVRSPTGDVTTLAYDAATGNRLWQQPGSDASRRVTFGYYSSGTLAGMLRTVTTPDVGTDSVWYDTTRTANLSKTKSPRGAVSLALMDAIGRDTLSATAIDENDKADTAAILGVGTAARGQRTRTGYNASGLVAVTTTYGPSRSVSYGTVPDDSVRVEHYYDREGNDTLTIRRYRRNAGQTADYLSTLTTYDGAGRVTSYRSPSMNATESFGYDPAGNRITHYTARGKTVTMTYDAVNRLVRRVVPQVDYYSGGCPIYDAWQYLCSYAMPTMATGGSMIGSVVGTSVCIPPDTAVFGYDAAGRMIRADNGAARIRRSYTTAGALATDQIAIRTYFASWGDTCTGTTPQGQEPASGSEWTTNVYTLTKGYDLAGRLTSITHPGGIAQGGYQQLYRYTATTGELASVRGVSGDSVRFTYDLAGRRTGATYPGGATAAWGYDADGRLTSHSVAGGGEQITYAQPVYDALGRVVDGPAEVTYGPLGAVLRSVGLTPSSSGASEEFKVDGLGNREWKRSYYLHPNDADRDEERTLSYTGEKLDSIRWVGAPAGRFYKQAFFYDESGNTSASYESVTRESGSTNDASRYYYSADEKLRATNRHVGFTSVGGVGSLFEEYRYDALGRRVMTRTRQNSSACWSPCVSSTTRVVWDGDQLLYEVRSVEGQGVTGAEGGTVAYTHAAGIDAPVLVTKDGTTIAPHADWRGNYVGGTDTGGHKCAPGSYCPWIEWPGLYQATDGYHTEFRGATSGTWGVWFGSLVTQTVDGSGMKYQRNRYYNPQTGRFTQEDPIGLAGGVNSYGFAGGDPVNFADPFGLCAIVCDIADIGFFLYSAGKAIANPTRANIRDAALDAAGLLPIVPSAGLVRHGGEAVVKITKAYKRPKNSVTPAQRASVQGKPCVDCGAMDDVMVADHKDPLVKEYYETGTIDEVRMRDVNSVQPQCKTCSNKQGAEMSQYSKEKKKEHGLPE